VKLVLTILAALALLGCPGSLPSDDDAGDDDAADDDAADDDAADDDAADDDTADDDAADDDTSTEETVDVEGTVSGTTLGLVSASWWVDWYYHYRIAYFVLSSYEDLCERIETDPAGLTGGHEVHWTVITSPTLSGTYSVVTEDSFEMKFLEGTGFAFVRLEAGGGPAEQVQALGQLDVLSFEPESFLAGEIDLVTPSQEGVSGSFTVAWCPALQQYVDTYQD
jgi:hypothetical protein